MSDFMKPSDIRAAKNDRDSFGIENEISFSEMLEWMKLKQLTEINHSLARIADALESLPETSADPNAPPQ